MIRSMTGFGSQEANIPTLGKVSLELRSSNHKFLETVFHLPSALLFLEERMKRGIEAELKRGRVTCVVNIAGSTASDIFINKPLLKKYILSLKNIQRELGIKDGVGLETLIHLPGVLSVQENIIAKNKIWPQLEALLKRALGDLVKMRQKEGRALFGYLKNRAEALKIDLGMIRQRFNTGIKEKVATLATDEERNSFLKESDISEEIERLAFHIRNFKDKLSKSGPVGKELDFIAQEMQREANTLAAKSFDVGISSRVVQMKSQIEKIREQVQNIE